jgi:probable rRNA maturation factor
LAIRFFTEEIDYSPKNKRILKNWIKEIVTSHRKSCGDINFIFTNNKHILEINLKYLNHDYFTDIITFNYDEDSVIAGDIYISIDTVRQNSLNFSTTFTDEIHRVIIHGVLHLLGYNDQTEVDKKEMTKAEDKSLSLL